LKQESNDDKIGAANAFALYINIVFSALACQSAEDETKTKGGAK